MFVHRFDVYGLAGSRGPRLDVPVIEPSARRHARLAVGANVKSVQAMLGHASVMMTLDTCADLFPEDLDAVAVVLDAAASQQAGLKVRSRD